jgi:photosystem II stability/assembly factor-like uncharacterized protein
MAEPEATPPRRRAASLVLVGLLVVAGAIWAMIWFGSRPVQAALAPLRWSAPAPAQPGEVAAISPSGVVWVRVARVGFVRSADGGRTWKPVDVSLPGATRPVAGPAPAFSPGDGSVLALASTRIVARSNDDGATWRPFGPPLPATAAALAVSPTGVVYALTARGVLAAMAGARSWRRLGGPRNGVAASIDPARPRTIVVAADRGGLWRSADAGRHWQRVLAGPPGRPDLVRSAARPEELVARLATTLVASTDAGASWRPLTAPEPTSLALDASTGRLYLVDRHGATWASRDGGGHWGRLAAEGIGPGQPLGAAAGTVYGSLGGGIGMLADRR